MSTTFWVVWGTLTAILAYANIKGNAENIKRRSDERSRTENT